MEILNDITKQIHPMLWLEEGADIDEENADKIKSMVVNPLLALDIVLGFMVAGGLVSPIAAILYHLTQPISSTY